jgi:hypothetical protein
MPDIDPQVIIAVVVGIICLVLLLAVIGAVVRAVTRTALIQMVHQITLTEKVTMAEGWRFGWSGAAWRLFLVELAINIPMFILALVLILLALSPLLLILTKETVLIVFAAIFTVFFFIFIILLFIALSAIITPLLELAWRRTVLGEQGVLLSISDTFSLVKRRFKDLFIMWLYLFASGIAWIFVALIVLFISLLVALIIGGLPALIVYLISKSALGAAVAGGPLALLVLILINGFSSGLYVIFRSAIWTLTYLEVQKPAVEAPKPPETPDIDSASAPAAVPL